MNYSLVYPGEITRFRILAILSVVFWVLLIVGTLGIALLYVLGFYVAYLFTQSAFISYLRGNAVKISSQQYPDLADALSKCCERLGMDTVPDVYLLHADGYFNALATRFLRRDYVVLFSTVVDALADRPEAVRFYIGHELGHIHRRHLTWGPVLAPVTWLPVLGAAHRRAQEYTCDRYGLACCDSAGDAYAGLAALAAGHSRWRDLDLAAFAAQREDVRGFWGSFHEYTSDYPWTAKRAFALSALAADQPPRQPGRNWLALQLALFVPRFPGAGGAGGVIIMIAIIGVLAAVAIPAYQDYVARAGATDLLVQTSDDKAAMTAYVMETQEWPATLEQINVVSDGRSAGEYPVALELGAEGDLLYNVLAGPMADGVITLVPYPRFEGEELVGLDWECQASGMRPAALPSDCSLQ